MIRLNVRRNFSKVLSALLFIIMLPVLTLACNGEGCKNNCIEYTTTDKAEAVFILSEDGISTPLLISPDDYPGIRRVASHLQSDIYMVTDSEPELLVKQFCKYETGCTCGYYW